MNAPTNATPPPPFDYNVSIPSSPHLDTRIRRLRLTHPYTLPEAFHDIMTIMDQADARHACHAFTRPLCDLLAATIQRHFQEAYNATYPEDQPCNVPLDIDFFHRSMLTKTQN